MAEEQSLAGQFDKLDAAISRDIERRRKTSFIYWALLFLTAAVAVLVILVGRSELETITDALTADVEFKGDVAAVVKNDAEVIDAIAESKPVRTAVRGEVQNIAQSDEFAATVLASDAFTAQIQSSAQQAATDYASQPAFLALVRENAGSLRDSLGRDIEQNRAELTGLRRRIEALAEGSSVDPTRLSDIERDQFKLTALMLERQSMERRLSKQVSQLTEEVAAMRERLEADQATIRELEQRLTRNASASSARSYLLKENAANELPDLGLTVVLGRLSKDAVESIELSDAQGPLDDGRTGPVRIGESFRITDRTGRKFDVTLSYSQGRFIARDFVGLEITERK